MKKNLIFFLVFFLLEISQATFLSHLAIFSVKPDLGLILVIAIALRNGENEGARAGFWAGLAQDLLFTKSFGLAIFTKVVTGYILGFSKKKFFQENIIVLVLLLLFGTILHDILYYFVSAALGYDYPFLSTLKGIIIPTAIFNTVLAPVAFWGVRRLYKLDSFAPRKV